MPHDLVHPAKARRGERIAVVSPSFAAAGAFPAVHEQAMRRLAEVTGLVPVEYPTTRKVGATALERAADLNAARENARYLPGVALPGSLRVRQSSKIELAGTDRR